MLNRFSNMKYLLNYLTKPNCTGHPFCSFIHSEYISHRKGMSRLSMARPLLSGKDRKKEIILLSLFFKISFIDFKEEGRER